LITARLRDTEVSATRINQLLMLSSALGAGANERAVGNLSHRIPRSEADELGQLADRFNMMADPLQDSLREIENQNARLCAGLELARDIQQGMLPTVPPWPADGFSVYGRSLLRPCADGGVICSLVEVGGLPIGAGLPPRYQDVTIDRGPDDTVLLLSDGIVEAHAPDGELFGFERLEALVHSRAPQISVGAIVERIIAAMLAFSANADPHDDATVIAIRSAIGAARAFADGDSSITTPDPAEALV
jgi:serine/threonine protein phosphatase PrpC